MIAWVCTVSLEKDCPLKWGLEPGHESELLPNNYWVSALVLALQKFPKGKGVGAYSLSIVL
jgi:hypothetical protein